MSKKVDTVDNIIDELMEDEETFDLAMRLQKAYKKDMDALEEIAKSYIQLFNDYHELKEKKQSKKKVNRR